MSLKIEKINDYNKKQVRDFVITDQSIYNFGSKITNLVNKFFVENIWKLEFNRKI